MTVPTYDPNEPARLQENDWDCSVESTEWALYAWGRTPDDDWLEQSMMAAGVVSPAVGLCDASGAGLARWVNTEYGEFGYWAENLNPVSFDQLASEAATLSHPIMAGGRAFFKGSTIERCYRDIRAAKFHPFDPEKTLVHGGRLALGLPVDEV